MRAGVFELEQTTEQILGRFTDEDGIGCRQGLKPRGKIRSFADGGTLLCHAGAEELANEPGGDADSRPNARSIRQFGGGDFGQDADCGANGTLGGILEGLGKAEISQNTVP